MDSAASLRQLSFLLYLAPTTAGESSVFGCLHLFLCYGTIRYDTVYLTYSKKLTCSQLSPPHGTNRKITEQELSYRKQIARQMRTQYVEGIYRPKYYTMTLKSRLRVTQGHWKRNHWIDHTRLTVSRVI